MLVLCCGMLKRIIEVLSGKEKKREEKEVLSGKEKKREEKEVLSGNAGRILACAYEQCSTRSASYEASSYRAIDVVQDSTFRVCGQPSHLLLSH
jgi:hypothetical protein